MTGRSVKDGPAGVSSQTAATTTPPAGSAAVQFTVPGKPVPQGSMRAFTRPGGHVGLTHGNEKDIKMWRALVAQIAGEKFDGPFRGPVRLAMTSYLQRPKGHYGTGRNAGSLKASAPRHPTTKPDTSKLLRSIEDALEGIAFETDAQVVDVQASKRYADERGPRTVVTVFPLEEEAMCTN